MLTPRKAFSAMVLWCLLVAAASPLPAQQSPATRKPKVYISVDMEGIAALAIPRSQMAPAGLDYDYGRRLMTAEANAAIAGAFDGGASAVTVSDSHGSEINLLADQLDGRAELITGKPRPYVMMEGIDSTFDAVVFVGYHPRASSLGHNDHTFSLQIKRISLNGTEVGEDGLSAALAAHFGVPVVFLSGDAAVAAQATAAYPGIVSVAVKEAIGRFAVKTINPAEAVARIRAGVKEAVSRAKSIRPVRREEPIAIEFEVSHTGQSEAALLIPGMIRVAPRVVRFVATDMPTAYRLAALVSMLVDPIQP
ncbi:MAG: M55 family metallopeptidase [Gemmatimonadales bacterium]